MQMWLDLLPQHQFHLLHMSWTVWMKRFELCKFIENWLTTILVASQIGAKTCNRVHRWNKFSWFVNLRTSCHDEHQRNLEIFVLKILKYFRLFKRHFYIDCFSTVDVLMSSQRESIVELLGILDVLRSGKNLFDCHQKTLGHQNAFRKLKY